MLFYLRERDGDLSIVSAGSGLIPWEGAMPLGRCNAGASALGRMVQLKPHRPPLPAPCPSPWGRAWVFGGVSRPSFLMAPGKSHAESIAKRASRGGRRL